MLVDVHCHLDAAAYADPEAACRESAEAGVTAIVAAGTGLASNDHILALHAQFPHQVGAAIGLHPERVDASWSEVEAVIEQIERHRDRIVAVGEIGLPHYALLDGRMDPEQARQHEDYLHALVKAAARLDLPVVLHAPHESAAARALAIVQRYEPPGAVFHWHKSTPETAAAICAAGYHISITPEVCYRDRDRQLARAVPLANLLLESDGPWAYGGEFSGRPTTSALVARAADEVAQIKGAPLDAVAAATTANAQRVFGSSVVSASV